MKSPLHITPFSIQIGAEILSDLRERIRNTRWPDQAPGIAWEQGTDLEFLRRLLAYWADEFDWVLTSFFLMVGELHHFLDGR
jgi:hypothetical protein